jgi:RimJ/RimL family protein N-acetyltransferase/nucleotide-binding universal stress UspA family protein
MAVDVALLPDGGRVRLRPIEPADRDALAAGFERLSPESRYRRFFSPVSRLSERQLDYLTRVDHHDHEALLAIDPEGDRLVGVARFVRTGPQEAEPAIVVADDWQGRGVASVLLDRLVERALEEGIVAFRALVLAGNPDAVRVLSRLGDTEVVPRGTEVELSIALHPEPPPSEGLREVLRAAAAGVVDPLVTFWHRLLPRGDDGEPDDERANLIVCAVEPDAGEQPPAVALAGSIARSSDAGVVLVAARSPLAAPEADVALRRRVAGLAAGLRRDGVDAREVVRTGDLAAIVLDCAVTERARLIVVDDPGGQDAAGRLLGSTWDHVSHHAPTSVLVARG